MTDSLVHIQKFMGQCLGVFNANTVYVEENAELRLQILDMVARYCSDQVYIIFLLLLVLLMLWVFSKQLYEHMIPQ